MLSITKEILQQYFKTKVKIIDIYCDINGSEKITFSIPKNNNDEEIYLGDQYKLLTYFNQVIKENLNPVVCPYYDRLDYSHYYFETKTQNWRIEIEKLLVNILKATLKENYFEVPEEESTLIYK